MELKKATRKYKIDNQTSYYFDNDNEVEFLVITEKFKSGYDVEIRDFKNGDFFHTDGIKNISDVQKYINSKF